MSALPEFPAANDPTPWKRRNGSMRSSPFSNAKARARPLPAGEARREGAPFRCLHTFLAQ